MVEKGRPMFSAPPPPPKDWDVQRPGMGQVGAVVVGITIISFVGLCLWGSMRTFERIDAERDYIARCIEFHSRNRCIELFHYGRTDLGLSKDR